MKKHFLLERSLVVGIIFLFVGLASIPQAMLTHTLRKNIITVDDEPGDADYTSIKDAVQRAQFDDTIQVYSGTYQEHDIDIAKVGLTIQGIAHELGSGNDTGKPVITSTNNVTLVYVWGDYVTITDFTIIDGSPPNLATFPIHIWGDYCTFANNTLTGGWQSLTVGGEGFYPTHFSVGTRIIGNIFEPNFIGIYFSCERGTISHNAISSCYQAIQVFDQATDNILSFNTITNCSTGISYSNGSNSIISHNLISAGIGIDLETNGMSNITIERNEFRQCRIGIQLEFKQSTITVKENNFIDNGGDVKIIETVWQSSNPFHPRILDGNYYDTWTFGAKRFWGRLILYEIPILWGGEFFFVIPIFIPWVYRDTHPASQPYPVR